MALGPGKYDKLCTLVRERAQARGVILMVFGGTEGTGFCVQTDDLNLLTELPEILRGVAGDIEPDTKKDIDEISRRSS